MKNKGFFSYKLYIHNEAEAQGTSQQVRERATTQENAHAGGGTAATVTGRTTAQGLRSGVWV